MTVAVAEAEAAATAARGASKAEIATRRPRVSSVINDGQHV